MRKILYTRHLAFRRPKGFITVPLMILTVLLSFSSCIKEEFNAEQLNTTLMFNPGIAAPVGWARYQMDEILYDSVNPDELFIDENGFMYLIYSMDPYTIMADEVIDIQNLQPTGPSINNPWDVTTDLDLLPEPYTFDTIVFVNLPITGTTDAAIDSIIVRYGEMTLRATSPYPQMFWRADILRDGFPPRQISLYDEINSFTDTLENVILTLDNTAPNSNALRFKLTITLWDTVAVIDPGPILDIDISLMELDYSAIYGYLGNFDISVGPETFELDFNSNLGGGNFTFEQPRLNINFKNSFGLPIEMDLTDFYGSEGGGLTHPLLPEPPENFRKTILYPLAGQEGLLVADSLVINRDNSNLVEVVSKSLSTFTASMTGQSNPAGPPGENFILDTSQLTVSADLVLPLSGSSDTISIADTLRFVFREYFDNPPEEILRLMFRVTYITQFPVDVKTQVHFLAEDKNTVLEVLFHEDDDRRIIKGAIDINGDGIADPSDPHTLEVELTDEQISNIEECHWIRVSGEVITSGNEAVSFYSYYFFDTDIAVIAELELNSDNY